MPEEQKPMLNTPVEGQSVAAEEFKKNVIGRMDRTHEALTELNRTLVEPPEQTLERVEKFKQDAFTRIEEMTGLAFDRDTGRCTTPGKVEMEGQVKERWIELCGQFGAETDPDKTRQLLQEMGRLLRGATGAPEALGHDETGR